MNNVYLPLLRIESFSSLGPAFLLATFSSMSHPQRSVGMHHCCSPIGRDCAMRLFLGGLSAFEYWNEVRLGRMPQPRPSRITSLRSCARREDDILAFSHRIALRRLSRPLDVLVTPDSSNHQSAFAQRQRTSIDLPKGSFCTIDDDIAIASPELCFLHLSRHLTLPEAVLLAYELHGDYCLLLDRDDRLENCRPLVSQQDLARFLDLCKDAKGAKQARKAVRYALDHARSPMEAKVAFLLSASSTVGGFGIRQPELNREMAISLPNGRCQVRSCDLLWQDKNLAIEYDSSSHHEELSDIDRDARRRNQLVLNGLTVLTVTRRQVRDFAYLEGLAGDIGRLLGERQRCRIPDIRLRRWKLHHALFSSSNSPLRSLHNARQRP